MKKFYFSFLLLIVFAVCVNAQSRQYALFEHFTQASCGPCADQNPAFKNGILDQNRGNIHHISYHTSWPGTDPMNAANPTPVQSRVDYYNVGGVPSMYMNGEDKGGPAGVSQSDVNNLNAQISPIGIIVTETGDTERVVSIEIKTTGDISGDYTLQTAVVERMVSYNSPPGNNGEKDFPNVFRETLTGSGESFTLAPNGESVTYTYSYNLEDSWQADEIYVIAFVQDNATKEVINSGSSDDPDFAFFSADVPFKASEELAEVEFTGSFNSGAGGFYNVRLVSNHPDDWGAMIDIAGQTSEGETLVSTTPNQDLEIKLLVNPSISPAVGEYTIEVEQFDNSVYAPQRVTYNVVSNVWDLVVNNDAGFGDGGEWGPFDVLYENGLEAVDNKYVSTMGTNAFINGMNYGALSGVKNIYFNVGWSFPSLTDDKVEAFKAFLDNGGNMLIAGQDIGWESVTDGYFTAATQDFYANYMHASFNDDGSTANQTLVANTADAYFGGLGEIDIDAAYNDFYYPDSFDAINGGTNIFTYNSTSGVNCGVRFENDTYKMVYLAVGLEMLSGTANQNAFMEAVHTFFYDGVEADPTQEPSNTGTNITSLENVIEIQVQPNPASDFITLSFDNLDKNATLNIFDIIGKQVATQQIKSGDINVTLDIQNFMAGTYFYQFTNKNGVLANGKFVVE